MKKITLVSILVFALTSFACNDDKGDGNLENGSVCTKHDDCASAFCKKAKDKQGKEELFCADKLANDEICENPDDLCKSEGYVCTKMTDSEDYKCTKSGQPATKLDNGKECTENAQCSSEFCQKDGDKKLCADKIADGAVCKNSIDECVSKDFSCQKAEGEVEFKCAKNENPVP